ncbi:hypothetical protein SDJN02_23006, partial [Cucurbita argyrosperma subsp. argyrosperma]
MASAKNKAPTLLSPSFSAIAAKIPAISGPSPPPLQPYFCRISNPNSVSYDEVKSEGRFEEERGRRRMKEKKWFDL